MSSMTIIAAMGANRVIGNKSKIPWSSPEDLRFFREYTINKTCVFGKKTFLNLQCSLDSREIIIVCRQEESSSNKIKLISDIKVFANHVFKDNLEKEVMICGGAEIYKGFLPFVSKMVLTHFTDNFQGDTFFPEINSSDWRLETIGEIKKPNGKIILYERM